MLAPLNAAEVVASWRQQSTGTITGHVTDGALKTPLSDVTVRVEGTALRTTANADGKYTITGVAPGTYHVTARRVGYQALTKEITIAGDQATTLDFALIAAPTRLDEVVTTAVGEQRRYEVGNVISTINADSIVPTAPVASITDLLSGRAPGVEVVETNGMVGSGEAIRIRGISSLTLQSDPIIIVDGIREDNSPGGVNDTGLPSLGNTGQYSLASPSRINDIDLSQIATIDILKGPAATTEYGTQGANGVIVITTKHGTSGVPQWHVSAEQAASAIPTGFPENYTGWGHVTDGTAAPTICPLSQLSGRSSSLAGNCVVDSVTKFNPLNNSAYSIFGTGPSSKYDLDVSGGSEALRYFVGGAMSTVTGGTHVPAVYDAQAAALGFPNSALKPNGEDQRSLRANTEMKLGATADMQVTAAYMSTSQETPLVSSLTAGPVNGISYPSAAYNYGYGQTLGYGPLAQLGSGSTQQTSRFTGGVTMNWRPTSWFIGHAIVGLDHGSQQVEQMTLPQSEVAAGYVNQGGQIIEGTGTNDTYTVDLRGTATAALTSAVRSTTSLGVQYTANRTAGLNAEVANLSATVFQFNGASVYDAPAQVANEAITLGAYASEVLSLRDRLFLTGSLRLDGASGFGAQYTYIAYPGAQVSWIAVNTQALTLRLRGALGVSGQQPPDGASLQEYNVISSYGPGNVPQAGYKVSNFGNPTLTAERSVEYEGGVDAAFFAQRLTVDISGYSKTTFNALYAQPLGFDLNNLSYEENLGTVRNTGVEASVTGVVVQTPMVHWTVTLNTSVNTNKLVSLAPGALKQEAGYESTTTQFFAPGYSLYGYWGNRETYADANHDGIIEANEVTWDTALTYMGPSLPPRQTSVQTYVGLWRDALTVGALFDYESGFRVYNEAAYYAYRNSSGAPVLQAANDPTAPLWMQARLQATGLDYIGVPSEFFEPGDFVRFRELSLTYNLPRRWLRAIRVTRLGLTGAVRNLALWTRYSGLDPEVSDPSGGGGQLTPGSNAITAANDLRASGFGAIPLTRTWTVRVNVGL